MCIGAVLFSPPVPFDSCSPLQYHVPAVIHTANAVNNTRIQIYLFRFRFRFRFLFLTLAHLKMCIRVHCILEFNLNLPVEYAA